MEATGFKRRLENAKNNSKYIKLIFQYPASDRAIIKRGFVKKIFNDCFDFEEKFDGLITYSYDYLVEIKEEVEEICAGRKLDYFARKKKEGWNVYGNEVKNEM